MRKKLRLAYARQYIDTLADEMSEKYDIDINFKDDMYSGTGKIRCGTTGDFSMDIGMRMNVREGFLSEYVDANEFVNIIRALYHEERHLVQNCKDYQNREPNDDAIIMSVRSLATDGNKEYYNRDICRYNNNLYEIDAEKTALENTYLYLKNIPGLNAKRLICNMVNEKTKYADYFITGQYSSVSDIVEAFEKQYERAKTTPVTKYIAWALRPSQDYNPKDDECIRYLQSCVRENPEEMKLLTQFNSVSDPHQKDLMIASIVCHLHPEIEYEKVYPCLSDIDLSPENIFDRELPQPPEGLIKPIPKEDIERRIELAKFIHDKIVESEMRQYSDESKSHKKEVLNESLVSERESEKTDEYGFM